jgi:GNAT superfamily N-acetyltransferase
MVATRLRSERLGELRREPGPRRIAETRIDSRSYDALGPSGDRSLLLLLARVEGSPAATGGVYFEPDLADLYCFTTRERMRGRGLASALVHTSHAAAQARGIERALLQATASARPVYIRAGYREQRTLPVLMRRGELAA